jgi:hypothetical protein
VRLVEVPDLHQRRTQRGGGVKMRALGLACLAGDPGLEIVVGSRVAEGLGAPRTESLAAHRARRDSGRLGADLRGDRPCERIQSRIGLDWSLGRSIGAAWERRDGGD